METNKLIYLLVNVMVLVLPILTYREVVLKEKKKKKNLSRSCEES
jgi:hypothetical protein